LFHSNNKDRIMIHNDKILGKPLVQYLDLRSNIEAITNPEQGMLAYSSDENKLLQYTGSVWTEVTGTGGSTWYNVINYGADPTGISDSTAEINAAAAAIPSSGGVLYFPAGLYLTDGTPIYLDNPTVVRGDGASSAYDADFGISTVRTTTTDAIVFWVRSQKCDFHDIFLHYGHVTRPTAGAGIYVESGGDNVTYENVTTKGFYYNVDVPSGAQFTYHNCRNIYPGRFGLVCHQAAFSGDFGDQIISDSWFISGPAANAEAGLKIYAGGGVKVIGCKFNGWLGPYGFTNDIDIEVGAGVNTGILLIEGCSIENWKTSGIKVRTNATKPSTWHTINIVGNELGSWLYQDTNAIDIQADTINDVRDVLISSNVFVSTLSPTGAAINLSKINTARITGDIRNTTFTTGYQSLLSTTDCLDIVIDADLSGPTSATDSNFASFDGITGKLIKDSGYNINNISSYFVSSEVLMADGITPPDPLTTEDETDWLYED
jgi:hypothetical protein